LGSQHRDVDNGRPWLQTKRAARHERERLQPKFLRGDGGQPPKPHTPDCADHNWRGLCPLNGAIIRLLHNSRDTEASLASIFATRDWLDRIRFAISAWVSFVLRRYSLTLRLSASFNSTYAAPAHFWLFPGLPC